MLLADRKVLVTGVLSEASIATSVARLAQEQGADVLLTSFGRALSLTRRVATLESHADADDLGGVRR